MDSWVHVLARFTPEALLFEALAILVVFASYLAFWILRKRRFGAAGEVVPAGLVKYYLNELIGDAEHVRTQLFGLLRQAGVSGAPEAMGPVLKASALMPAVNASNTGSDATQTIEALKAEKLRLEKELEAAKAAGTGAAPASAAAGAAAVSSIDSGALKELRGKVESLEAKLAEYSVIEDDLANLKRLQQENAKLREALQSQGGNVEETLASISPPAAPETSGADANPLNPDDELAALAALGDETPAADEPPAEDLDALLGELGENSGEPAPAEPATETLAAAEQEADAESLDPAAFEGLLDSVDESLQTQPDAPAEEPTAVEAATPAPAAEEKNNADLVAEFEKMLNG